MCNEFEELADQYAPEHCPDSVWVLNKGFINWTKPKNGKIDPGPMPDAGYMAVEATPQQMLIPRTAHCTNTSEPPGCLISRSWTT